MEIQAQSILDVWKISEQSIRNNIVFQNKVGFFSP